MTPEDIAKAVWDAAPKSAAPPRMTVDEFAAAVAAKVVPALPPSPASKLPRTFIVTVPPSVKPTKIEVKVAVDGETTARRLD